MFQKKPAKSLKQWFMVHFIVDVCIAIPLLIAPVQSLQAFEWMTIDPFATRLIAAALFGIGGVSYICQNASRETFKALLDLKILWSLAAMIGLLISIFENPQYPKAAWLFLSIFLLFFLVWAYYRNKLK